jgi:chromate transporter
LAIDLGYVHYGVWGATCVGLAFVLPSFLMVLAIGAAYVMHGGLTWMQAVFYGVGACVIGIIAWSAYSAIICCRSPRRATAEGMAPYCERSS